MTLASYVERLAGGQSSLNDAATKQLEERMTALYPNGGLAFLIAMNSDPIARELNGPR